MLTTAIAIYGAALSSFLGFLTWHRERQQIYFAPRYVKGHDTARLEVVVVNTGHRPVTLSGAFFEYTDGGGYWPMSDDEDGLPRKLAEGDSLTLTIDHLDLDPQVSALVMEGYPRDFRHDFDAAFRKN
jgi:hypothetical protein